MQSTTTSPETRELPPLSAASIVEIQTALRSSEQAFSVLVADCGTEDCPAMRERLAAVREALHATEVARPARGGRSRRRRLKA